jgi:AcrR family transcriptional regulator
LNKSDIKRQAILDTAYRLFRAQGFARTSIAKVTAHAGGSKATIYRHFSSKEALFVECMMLALENYMSGPLEHLDTLDGDLEDVLRNFGTSVLNFLCSPEQVEVRRLIIAEAARSGTGKLFFDKITALRLRLSSFLAACMERGMLRHGNPDLAADQLGALLEAELLEPLLLHVRDAAPDAKETSLAAQRAIVAFLRAYAPAVLRTKPVRGRIPQRV